MKHSLRKVSVIVVLGALVALLGSQSAFFGSQSVDAAAVTMAEDQIEWSDTSGNAITSIRPDVRGHFFIKDGALETTKGGTAVFDGIASSSTFFNVASGAAGTNSSTATTTSVTRTLTAADYDTTTPANTPLTGYPTANVTGVGGVFVSSADVDAGTFSTITGVSATTTATFSYHIADSWSGADTTLRRAKITSTSDPAGEWITIGEVTSLTATTTNATSQLFHGNVELSSNAAKQGTNSDGVWVQDGDTVTATYYDSAAVVIDSTTLTVDGVKPTISGLTPVDGTTTNVANPTVQFDVTDAGSGISTTSFATDIALAINNATVTPSLISYQAISNGFRAIFAQGTLWTAATSSSGFAVSDSTEFSLTITASDQAGNIQEVSGTSANVTIDRTAPTVTAAVTGAANTAIVVTFSEDLDAASIAAADFTLDSGTVSAAVQDATDENKVNLTVSAMDADAKPVITISTIDDPSGNSIVAASTITPTDGVKAALSTITVDKSLAILADVIKTSVTTDEKLAVDGLVISAVGPAGATTNGGLTVTSPTPNTNEGSFTVVAGDTTGVYGVAIQATDLGGNTTNNLTAVTDEAATVNELDSAATGYVDTNLVTLGNGPIGDADFDGDVDAADITVKVGTTTATATTTSVTIGAVDASARTVVVTSGITDDSVVLVSYSHATDNFEIDQSAPTVTFDPDGTSDVKNQSPYIRVIFDEDEYPGDSYKTVELTKASLLYPDGTTSDLLTSFTTADNIEFIWGATDLPLGAYELTVSATDTATNDLTDSVGKFTIAKRSVAIALRPGWNLVSLPDDPAATANGVNDVFSSDKIDVVLTYDPASAAGWLSATRVAGGATLESETLTTVSSSRAYWVHSTAIVSLTVDLPGLAPGSATLPPAFDLQAGWNLVPYATADLSVTSRDADDYFTGLEWSRAYSFSNTANSFVGLLPGTATQSSSDTVALGSGYWIYLREAGTLVP